MSHFLVGVIVPGNTPIENMESCVESLMEPFNEELKVEEYECPCHCIGEIARKDATETANLEHGTIDSIRGRFWDDPQIKEIKDDRLVQKAWKEYLKPWDDCYNAALEAHPEKYKPNPNCGFYTGEKQDWWAENKSMVYMLIAVGICCLLCGVTVYLTYEFATQGAGKIDLMTSAIKGISGAAPPG